MIHTLWLFQTSIDDHVLILKWKKKRTRELSWFQQPYVVHLTSPKLQNHLPAIRVHYGWKDFSSDEECSEWIKGKGLLFIASRDSDLPLI